MSRDEAGMFFIDTQGNDKITRVYQENTTGEFYTYKVDTSSLNTNSKSKILSAPGKGLRFGS